MRNLRQGDARLVQAVTDRLRRNPRPMLDPQKPLLFGCCDETSVFQNAGRRIAVIRVETNDEQMRTRCNLKAASFFMTAGGQACGPPRCTEYQKVVRLDLAAVPRTE